MGRLSYLKDLLVFSMPIIFGHVGIMLIGTGDMLIAGHYSREALAAIGLAISISNPIMMLALGLLFSVSPILAQKRGRGEDISDYFFSVLLYGLVVGLLGSVLTLLSIYLLPLFGYSENLTALIREYLIITAFSILGVSLYQAVKEFYQAQEKTIAPNVIALIAAGLNVGLNHGLVNGVYGFPYLKEAGLAWASLSIRSFMALSLLVVAFGYLGKNRILKKSFFKEAIILGTPISFSIFLEVMAFCSVTLFVGKFEEVQTAANNIVLNIASLAFMVPLSIAAATAVKVGHAFGENDPKKVRIFAEVSLKSALTYTITMALIFYLFPKPILSIFSTDEAVLLWGARLIFLVCCFQLFDGAQVIISGILRGLSITRAPSVAIFIGYWIIGIPLGYYLGFYKGYEAEGFWIGLAVSLALVAGMLGVILRKKLRALDGPLII